MIQQHNVDAIIGPSTTPNALAILSIIAEAKVPLVTTVGSQAVVEPQDAIKRWAFKTTQNDDLIAEALVAHMARAKVKRLAYVGFNDPFGEGFLKILPGLLAKYKIELVATEKYSRTDQSVTGQSLKIIAAKPDAVFVAAVGGPAVLPQATLRYAIRASKARFIRRTPLRRRTSSRLVARRLRARCSQRAACWCLTK